MSKIGICGCGNMGEALAVGMVKSGLFPAKDIGVFDVKHAKAQKLAKTYRVHARQNIKDLVGGADYILLAIKPQDFRDAALEIKGYLGKRKIIISIMAGVTIRALRIELKREARLVRAMPNMPATIARGITAVTFTKNINMTEKRIIQKIFRSVGEILEVRETHLDAVTALSGSGPAYVFYFAAALFEAGRRMGLSVAQSKKLTLSTMSGSALLLEGVKKKPDELIKRVASKGGTTEAALRVLKKKNVRFSITQSVLAAKQRARELSSA